MRNSTRPAMTGCLLSALLVCLLGCTQKHQPSRGALADMGPNTGSGPTKDAGPAASPFAEASVAPELVRTAAGTDEGKKLLLKKCRECHTLDRVKERRETKEGWTKIVKKMQGKKKDWISDDQAEKIIAYLAQTYGK